jgi:hypothetical protein
MAPVSVDWPDVYEAWSAGEPPEAIAQRHGIQARTVRIRCGWVDHHFPPADAARMRALVGALAVRALEAAGAGDLDAAERLGRIIAPLSRILNQLETRPMKPDKPSRSRTRTSQTGTPSRDATEQSALPGSDEHKQLVAELEARLDALARSIEQSAHSGGREGGPDGPG